ncbi:hypothetical protein [uncultured Clostridium sp.]|uniref:hypothetical protein n=1 Tax=uncultured Clostridium sp. TaxID=59620 RepID=UPI00260797F1|nr:hypothetical protein [uncultured Clostridium sp.]
MRFFNNFKLKKEKFNYETLLSLKDSLDDISLKSSILNDRIISYKKNLSLSFDKIDLYITKISIAYRKNNISLCKKGFIKYYKETLILNNATDTYSTLKSTYDNLTNSLIALQNLYTSIENEYSIQSSSLFSPSLKSLNNAFSKEASKIHILISTIESIVPKKNIIFEDINENQLFKNKDEFLYAFQSFINKNLLNSK